MTASTRRAHRALVLVAALLVVACSAQGPSSAPTVAPTQASVTAAATPVTSEAPAVPTASPSPTPTVAPTPASTPSPTPSPAPAATPEPSGPPTGRTGRVTLDDIGLTMTLPKGWRSLPLTRDDLDEILGILPSGTIPAGFEEQVATLVASGLQLFAVDTHRANRGANVTVLAIATEVPLASVRTFAELGLSRVTGVRDIRYRETTVDGAAALRVDYALVLKVQGHRSASTGVQLWVPRDGATLVITVSTPDGGQPGDRDALLRSLRLD